MAAGNLDGEWTRGTGWAELGIQGQARLSCSRGEGRMTWTATSLEISDARVECQEPTGYPVILSFVPERFEIAGTRLLRDGIEVGSIAGESIILRRSRDGQSFVQTFRLMQDRLQFSYRATRADGTPGVSVDLSFERAR
jgi:hypothetical protein